MKHNSITSKDSRKSFGSIFNKPTIEDIFELLIKDKNSRSRLDLKHIGRYLYENYAYFRKMKDNSEAGKYKRMISVLQYVSVPENANIINFGEIGDKAYILLKGKIGIYKPRDVEKRMTLEDFEEYLLQVKVFEGNMAKYNRLLVKNSRIDVGSPFSAKHRIYDCIIEEEELLGSFGEGFNFGDIALLKKAPRNATVKSLEQSYLVSIDQYNYNEILKELEEKRLEKDLDTFKNTYPLFKSWTNNNVLHLFNCLQRINLFQGEYLYRQNDDSDCIYIVKSGEFEVYSIINFQWVNDFIKYILYSKSNIVNTLKSLKGYKSDNELKKIFNATIERNLIELGPCPCHKAPTDAYSSIHLSRYPKQDNIINIKLNEDKLNKQSFKVKIRKVQNKEVLGYEDSIELKNRFTTAKCISAEAIVDKIPLFDLFRLLNNLKDTDRNLFTHTVSMRKLCLINLIRNAAKIKAMIIEDRYADKYTEIIQDRNTDELTKRLALKFRKSNNRLKKFFPLKRTKSMNMLMVKTNMNNAKRNMFAQTQMKLFPTLVPYLPSPLIKFEAKNNNTLFFKSFSYMSTPFEAYNSHNRKKKTEDDSIDKTAKIYYNTKRLFISSRIKEIFNESSKENSKAKSIVNWENNSKSILLSTLSPPLVKNISSTTREITKLSPFESSCFSIKKKKFKPSQNELSICRNVLMPKKE